MNRLLLVTACLGLALFACIAAVPPNVALTGLAAALACLFAPQVLWRSQAHHPRSIFETRRAGLA